MHFIGEESPTMINGLCVRYGIKIALAASILMLGSIPAIAAGPVNTVNDGRIVNGGTYYNTSNGKTTFINSGSGGLWIQNGTTVRGLEMGTNGVLTNNGGTLHFLAPDSVVRIDGKVDVSGIANGQGIYLGNGGHVFIDAAYLHHAGQIFANGVNGGLVQMNVGAATVAPGARIDAKGQTGNGGVIAINSDGIVNIGYLALLDSSGRVSGNYDSNVINIEGGVVQTLGVLRADGIASTTQGSHGGTVRLVATGNTNTDLVNSAFTDATKISAGDPNTQPTVSTTEVTRWQQIMKATLAAREGTILVGNDIHFQPGVLISASGSRGPVATNNDITDTAPRAGDGGTIILSAMGNIYTFGSQIAANGGSGISGTKPVQGGNGGTIVTISNDGILNTSSSIGGFPSGITGLIQANGGSGGSYISNNQSGNNPPPHNGANGGTGGLIAYSYNNVLQSNSTVIQANGGNGGNGGDTHFSTLPAGQGGKGGQGGLMVFSGESDPLGRGSIETNGGRGGNGGNAFIAGVTGGSGGAGGHAGVIVSPNPQLLSASILASQRNGGNGRAGSTTSGPSIQPPLFGASQPFNAQTAENELLTHNENLILLTRQVTNGARELDLLQRGQSAVRRSVIDPFGTGAAIREMLTKEQFGSTQPYRNFLVGSTANNLNLLLNKEPVFAFSAGEVNLYNLNTLTVVNDGYVTNTFSWGVGNNTTMAGGRISILASGNIENGTGLDTAGELAGGSINLASLGSVNNFDFMGTSTLNDGNGIHGGSLMLKAGKDITNFGFRFIGSNGDLIGGIERYNANGNFTNLGDITANAFRTDDGLPTNAGCVYIRTGAQFQNGNDVFNPATISANATGGNQGWGGLIRIRYSKFDNTFGTLNTDGSFKQGTTELDPM
jgi:hypothetical protein